ncbi:MAG: OmpA family protein [Steroidobacteraceae bacterium]|jgi:outer membrane protein OmpA-like peptidoglycan-associated protein
MRRIACWTLFGALAFGAQCRADDCVLGQRYLALARDRIAAYQNDEAIAFLRQSVDACPAYEAYEQLGELAAQSTERDDKQRAVDAFIAAHQHATTAATRARALFQYATLLNREGDPENAYPLIKQARTLDPGNREISDLAAAIEQQVQHPTQEHIVRALRYSLYKPLAYGDSKAAGGDDSRGAKHMTPSGGGGPSVNIPINFNTGSVIIDDETRPNVAVLAHALADPSMQGREFLFIGHSDARGGDQLNVSLSLQRAEATSQSVIALEPSLAGRIHIEGHGAREPIDLGSDERALRANRRLQVLIK